MSSQRFRTSFPGTEAASPISFRDRFACFPMCLFVLLYKTLGRYGTAGIVAWGFLASDSCPLVVSFRLRVERFGAAVDNSMAYL